MKGLAILILLGLLGRLLLLFAASLTGGDGRFPWGTWVTLAALAGLGLWALVAVARGK